MFRVLPSYRRCVFTIRRCTTQSTTTGGSNTEATDAPTINDNVPGLSERVVKSTPEPVGPGATKTGEYKVPEYFCFNRVSYYEAEIELAKYRLPQPSALPK